MADVQAVLDAIKAEEAAYPGRALMIYRAYKANQNYFYSNSNSIRTRFGGKILIISKREVVSASDNFKEYSKAIDELNPEDRAAAYVVRIPEECEG